TKYYSDKVTISAAGQSLASLPTPLNINKSQELAKVDGVAAVSSNIFLLLDENGGAVSFGPPPGISGSDLKGSEYENFKINYSSGRGLQASDIGKVTVGADLVKKMNAKVGGTVTLRGKQFEVVGIMNK